MPELSTSDPDHRARSINHEIDLAIITCFCGFSARVQLNDAEIEAAETMPSLAAVAALFDAHITDNA